MNLLIVAGGQGTKLWPLSRESKPKQFQQIIGDQTLFSYQVRTLLEAYSPRQIFVSTKKRYVQFVKEQAPEVLKENLIIEPDYQKNRGPGEGYAFLKLQELSKDEPFMLIQSDVIRTPEERFFDMIGLAEKLVKRDKKFITVGQKATYPDMGSDYLELGDSIESENDIEVFRINRFIKRLNDFKKTKELVRKFRVSTHCNHTCWYPSLILEDYKKYRPDWYRSLMQIKETFGRKNESELTDKIYSKMQEGMTEEVTIHSMKNGCLIMSPFKWRDIGSWGSISEFFSDDNGNYLDGNILNIDSKGVLIKGQQKKLIATLGVKDLVIVDTDDALLVTTKEKAGNVKEILDKLREKEKPKYF